MVSLYSQTWPKTKQKVNQRVYDILVVKFIKADQSGQTNKQSKVPRRIQIKHFWEGLLTKLFKIINRKGGTMIAVMNWDYSIRIR